MNSIFVSNKEATTDAEVNTGIFLSDCGIPEAGGRGISLGSVSAESSGIRLCGILWNLSQRNPLEFVLGEEGEGLLFLLGVDPRNIDPKIIDAGP